MLQANPFNGRVRRPLPSFYGRRRRSIDADASALVARMNVAPATDRAERIDRLVRDLKAAGAWDRIAVLHIHAAHDAQAAGLNWKGASFTATPVNAPDFLPDRGFAGDGASSHLDLGAGYASVPLIGLADHTELVWSLTDSTANGRDAGAAGTANTAIVGRTGGNLNVKANSTTTTLVATVANSLGLYGFARNGTSVELLKDGTVLATLTDTATAFSTGNLTTLRGATTYSNRRIAVRIVGRHLGGSVLTGMQAGLLAYLQGVGAA